MCLDRPSPTQGAAIASSARCLSESKPSFHARLSFLLGVEFRWTGQLSGAFAVTSFPKRDPPQSGFWPLFVQAQCLITSTEAASDASSDVISAIKTGERNKNELKTMG